MTCPNYITSIMAAARTVISDLHSRGDVTRKSPFFVFQFGVRWKTNQLYESSTRDSNIVSSYIGERKVYNSLDRKLNSMSLTQKVLGILERWKELNPLFRYSRDSRGNIFFRFRGVTVCIAFPETVFPQIQHSWHVNCFVIPKTSSRGGLLPNLLVNFPFDTDVLNILWGYYDRMFYSYLTVGLAKKAIAISPTVFLPENLLNASSLLHAFTEISSGYWYLTKEFFNSGILENTLSTISSNGRAFFEGLMHSCKGMQMGCLSISIDQLNFDEKWCPLPFNNLIGYGPKQQKEIDKLFQKDSTYDRIGNWDVLSIQSKDLKSLIWSIKDLIEACHKKTELQTLHQGFPLHVLKERTLADYRVFLGVRFSVKVADAKSFSRKEIEEWKESLLFQPEPTFLGRYAFEEDEIRFNINLPMFLAEQHNLLFPEIDSKHLGKDFLRHSILSPKERMRRDVNVWQKISEGLKKQMM